MESSSLSLDDLLLSFSHYLHNEFGYSGSLVLTSSDFVRDGNGYVCEVKLGGDGFLGFILNQVILILRVEYKWSGDIHLFLGYESLVGISDAFLDGCIEFVFRDGVWSFK